MDFHDLNPQDDGSFPDGKRDWEPENPEQWADVDPLNPSGKTWAERFLRFYDAQVEFLAWSRLPARLRALALRERHISAFLQNRSAGQGWTETSPLGGYTFRAMGVGRRSWEQAGLPGVQVALAQQGSHGGRLRAYATALCRGRVEEARWAYQSLPEDDRRWLERQALCIVLSFAVTVPPRELVLDGLNLPHLVAIEQPSEQLAEFGLDVQVPVVVEDAGREEETVGPSPGAAGQAGATLQPGVSIQGNPQAGLFPGPRTGTLTGVVEYVENGQTHWGLVSAGHVLGQPGDPVHWNNTQVGTVVHHDSGLDISLAELTASQPHSRRVLTRNLDPAPCIAVINGMPVEYCGSASGAPYEAYVRTTYNESPSFYNLGKVPVIEIEGISQKGDSGALVLSGHNGQDSTQSPMAHYQPALPPNDLSAMVGVLVKRAERFTGPGQQRDCLHPETAAAVLISDITARFGGAGYSIHWLTR